MVLVGIGIGDGPADVETIAKKIISLRVFDDNAGNMWKASVKDIAGDILCVSQFTLMANTAKGSKPDFHNAMPGEMSKALYSSLLLRLGEQYDASKVKDGRFGAMMSVSLVNEGPVTLQIDSRKFEYVSPPTHLPKTSASNSNDAGEGGSLDKDKSSTSSVTSS